jgi:GT2 family glycosyltransferase
VAASPSHPPADRPLVSVVVLSYRRPACLVESLESLLAQTWRPIEFIVVDNPSDASEVIAREVARFPEVRLVRNPVNSGYTGGMNCGLAMATGRYVHLTLDDVVTSPESVESLVNYAETHPDPGVLTGIAYEGRNRVICCAGGHFDLAAMTDLRFPGCGEVDTGQFTQPFGTGFFLGSMLFGRRDYLQWLGGFREDFFMYAEDVELSARVLALGHSITVVPAFKTFPATAGSNVRTPPSSRLRTHSIKNNLALYTLHAPWPTLPRFYWHQLPLSLLRDAIKLPANFLPRVRAVSWLVRHLPRLWIDRRRWQRRVQTVREHGWESVAGDAL